MRNSFINELFKIAITDNRVMLLTGDLGFGVLEEFAEKLPDQYINCGVAEQNMTAVAAGLALEGKIPFTYSIGNFPTLRCLEHIRNDVAYHDLPVKIVCIGGGFSYGQLGMSHHATEDLSIMRSIPGMSIYVPCSENQAAYIAEHVIKKSGPSYLRLDKDVGSTSTLLDNEEFESATVLRKGSDLTIMTTGGIVKEAEKAAKVLESNDSISCDVLAIHSIKPIDNESIINSIKKTKRVITLEEHTIEGGLGSIVSELCCDSCLELKAFKRIGLDNEFSSLVGNQDFLRAKYRMDADSIYLEARKFF